MNCLLKERTQLLLQTSVLPFSGARCVATLLHEMKRRGKDCRFGVISMCIGVALFLKNYMMFRSVQSYICMVITYHYVTLQVLGWGLLQCLKEGML